MEEIRFGVVLPSYVYNRERQDLAGKAFSSLMRTKAPSCKPKLLLLIREGEFFCYPERSWFGCFDVQREVNSTAQGTEQTLAYGTMRSFLDLEATHTVWMGDDALFNPNWLVELEALVRRHPGARSWSVYRSAYTAVHWEHFTDPATGDVMVNSICGHGMTFTKEEWGSMGVNWAERLRWDSAYGNTLDMYHAANFKGQRWVTPKSYVEHTGRCGVNCRPEIPEYAQFFQGE